MCSTQYLPFLNPACSLRSIGSRAVEILFRITLLNTLLVMDNSVIPLQFLQRLRFPFFGSWQFNDKSGLPIYGYFFFFPYFLVNVCYVSVMTSPPAFSIFALTPSAPGAFPDFMLSIADFTSFAVGGSMLTSRPSSFSGMSSTSLGAFLLRMVSTCVFHSCVCSSTLVITTPSAYFIGMSQFLKPPAYALVILYNVAIFCICAAVSASSARFSMNALLSAFVFLFTSLSRVEYLVCSCSFIRCDLVSLIFFFVSFLSSIVFHVSVFIHSSFRFFCNLVVTCLFRLAPG